MCRCEEAPTFARLRTEHGPTAQLPSNPRLACNCYRRFVQSFGEVVWGIPPDPFERRLAASKRAEQVEHDYEFDSEALARLMIDYREIALEIGAERIPDDVTEPLSAVARAVYRSWDHEEAKVYRRRNRLKDLAGTAVTIQTMVSENGSGRSGAGVAFTRNPATGEKKFYADFLFDAQGEEVVSGRRRPGDWNTMATKLPAVTREQTNGAARLEQEFADVQDIEFTVENAQLYFLQTRTAKRTPRAALSIAVDLVREGLIDVAEGLRRVGDIEPATAVITRFADAAKPIASATPPGMALRAAASRLTAGGPRPCRIRATPSFLRAGTHRPRMCSASALLQGS